MKKIVLLLSLLALSYYSYSQEFIDEVIEVDTGTDTPKKVIKDGMITSIYKESDKYGFKLKNKENAPAVYDRISISADGWYIVKKGQHYGAVNHKAQLIIPIQYESINGLTLKNSGCFLVQKNGKWGAVTTKNEEALPIKYPRVIYCSPKQDIALVADERGKQHFLHKNGKRSDEIIESITIYKNGFIASVNGKYGFVKGGVITIPFQYDRLGTYLKHVPDSHKGLTINHELVNQLLADKNGLVGLIDITGKTILPLKYDRMIYHSSKQLYQFAKGNKRGFYDIQTKLLVEPTYNRISFIENEYLIVQQGTKKGVLTRKGELIVPIEYTSIKVRFVRDSQLRFEANKHHKTTWLDKNGQLLFSPDYTKVEKLDYHTRKDLYKVYKGKTQGIITGSGQVLVPVQYDFVYTLNDLFVVSKDNKLGLYNTQGKQVQAVEYEKFKSSHIRDSKLIIAFKNGFQYLIDHSGQLILPNAFKEVRYIHNTLGILHPAPTNATAALALVDETGNCGVFDEKQLRLIIPLSYEQILQKFETTDHSYFVLRKDGKHGIVNEKNEYIIPFKYEVLNLDKVFLVPSAEALVIAQKKGKFGLVSLRNEVKLPFKYQALKRIASLPLYKAKKGKHFMVINASGAVINEGPFDEVSDFEGEIALTFFDGQMRTINTKGEFSSTAQVMKPHEGYTRFEDLKQAFIQALNSPDDQLLKDFAQKVAPSQHLLYFLKTNMFNDHPLANIDTQNITDRYYQQLLNFKHNDWKSGNYNKKKLLEVPDFTSMRKNREGFIKNWRPSDQAFGSRFLEPFLRHCIKINGYWISSYFMNRKFK